MYYDKCEHCGQRYADTDRCCVFCGAPLPAQMKPSFDTVDWTNCSFPTMIRVTNTCTAIPVIGDTSWDGHTPTNVYDRYTGEFVGRFP